MRLAKLNDIEIDVVTNENMNEVAEISEHPIEFGKNITDHVNLQPIEVNIDGAFTKADAPDKIYKIQQLQRKKKLIKYVGRNIISNAIITSFSHSHNANNRLGFDFSITLREVKIARKTRFGSSKNKKLNTQISKKISQGRKQVMSR